VFVSRYSGVIDTLRPSLSPSRMSAAIARPLGGEINGMIVTLVRFFLAEAVAQSLANDDDDR